MLKGYRGAADGKAEAGYADAADRPARGGAPVVHADGGMALRSLP